MIDKTKLRLILRKSIASEKKLIYYVSKNNRIRKQLALSEKKITLYRQELIILEKEKEDVLLIYLINRGFPFWEENQDTPFSGDKSCPSGERLKQTKVT